jgi:hypothetical protein
MKRFDVALWCVWPSLWPEYIGMVEADSAFSAIIQVMMAYGLQRVARGTAIACDKSLRYSCVGLSGVSRGLVWFAGRGSRFSRKEVKQ